MRHQLAMGPLSRAHAYTVSPESDGTVTIVGFNAIRRGRRKRESDALWEFATRKGKHLPHERTAEGVKVTMPADRLDDLRQSMRTKDFDTEGQRG